MVSTLDSEASRVGSNPGRVYFVLFLARKFTLTVPLSTQEYKLVPANLMLGEPFRGWQEILLVAFKDRLGPVNHLARMQTYIFQLDGPA